MTALHSPPPRILPHPQVGSPEQVVAAWPLDLPLAAFGLGPASPWSRWAVLAQPSPDATLRARHPADVDPLLARVFASPPSAPPAGEFAPPFVGGWIGSLAYSLGRLLEPRATAATPPPDDRGWPAAFFLRCDRAWCYDKHHRQWFAVGRDAAPLPTLTEHDPANPTVQPPAAPPEARGLYTAAVARALEYIRAGDIYQANLAHRLTIPFGGATRPAFRRLLDTGPWYGCTLVDDEEGLRRAVLSASPELFFRYDARSRTIITRPMKGTRPAGEAASLQTSAKDRAELAMIVDLMRNDLGRVCAFGSVRVDQGRTIEQHGDVLQAVSSVSGRLREPYTLADVVRALFPGGSITGAPKIRAMQVIEELERAARGPYCGALGFVSDSGDACFSMAIRTMAVQGSPGPRPDEIDEGVADYWVGAGIVADSLPDEEWAETLVKASPIARAFGGGR